MVRLLLFSLAALFAANLRAEEFLACRQVHSVVKRALDVHPTRTSLTDPIKRLALKKFLEILDPGHNFFLESEVQFLLQPDPAFLAAIGPAIKSGDLSVFQGVQAQLGKTKDAVVAGLLDIHQHKERILAAASKTKGFPIYRNFPKTPAERNSRLYRLVLSHVAMYLREGHSPSDAFTLTVRSLERNLSVALERDERALAAMVAKCFVNAVDPHSIYYTESETEFLKEREAGTMSGIGSASREVVNGYEVMEVDENGPAKAAGLKPGDIITHVDGHSVEGAAPPEVSSSIKGSPETSVHLTFLRDGKKMELDIVRGKVTVKNSGRGVHIELLKGNGLIFGVIRFKSFYDGVSSELMKELVAATKEHDVAAVILDLRGNGGGSRQESVNIASIFVPEGTPVNASIERTKTHVLKAPKPPERWSGPVIVLVDKSSASSSEALAGTLQDLDVALVIGAEQTFGKGTGWINDDLRKFGKPGSLSTTMSIFVTPSGRSPQLNGIVPHIVLPDAQPAPLEKYYANAVEPYRTNPLEPPMFTVSPFRALLPALIAKSAARRAQDARWQSKHPADIQALYMEEALNAALDWVNLQYVNAP